MRLPILPELYANRDFIEAFGGYNHNLRIGDGEFYDMKNLTSSFYPLLAPRKKRGVLCETTGTPLKLIEKDALCYVSVSNGNLFFNMNGNEYDLGITTVNADIERGLTSMGAYVIIMPDKKYINTADTTDKGNIEASYISPADENVLFDVCRADGTSYEINMVSPNEPTENIINGYVWLDTSATPNSLKVYSEASAMWTSVATTYIKITATGIGANFNEFDGVKVSGVNIDSANDLNNTMVIYAKGDDYIVVVGILNDAYSITQEEQITVERLMPEMDFIVESNNRLWGCRYGLNRDGDIVNELYASKLADFKNWNCFLGLSTDSYYVSLGTDGQFTGAFSYLGQPIFFKENCLHMVYGNYPAQYQVQDTACRGVQKGSEKSLSMVNEVLYYKSRTSICAFDGSLPVELSSNFGEKSYSNAVGCGHKNKYYISMQDNSNGEYVIFVLDTEKGMWHKEDNTQIKDFCSIDDELYYIDGTQTIKTMFGSGTVSAEQTEWMAETGILGCSAIDKKYISRLSVRLSMEVGTRVSFFIEYDSSGVFEQVCTLAGHNLRTHTVPIRPKRCDHLRLRIVGKGDAKIYSISKTVEQGSDI